MKNKRKNNSGITIIALIVTIVVMLILAAVSINAAIGDDGIIQQAAYSNFLSEMTVVQEAFDNWKTKNVAENDDESGIPIKGVVSAETFYGGERLSGEIGYYRVWSLTNTIPDIDFRAPNDIFNMKYDDEFVEYPAGIQDLFWLDTNALDLKNGKNYIIDATNSIIYSVTGASLKGIRVYSLPALQAIETGIIDKPVFAEAEVKGTNAAGNYNEVQYFVDSDGNYIDINGNIVDTQEEALNPNYNPIGFKLISDHTSSNIYKLYNNGDLYGKGIKGAALASSKSEMDNLDYSVWRDFEVPSIIPGANTGEIKIYPKSGTIFVIDRNGYLWGWGNNSNNKMGLTSEQLIEYTGKIPTKIEIGKGNKKPKDIFMGNSNQTFVITTDNELYGVGNNEYGQIGVGYTSSQVNEWTKINFSGVENIIDIQSETFATTIVKKNGNKKEFYSVGDFRYITNTGESSLTFTRIFNSGSNNFEDEIDYLCFNGHSNLMFLKDGTGLTRNWGGQSGGPAVLSTNGTRGTWKVLDKTTYGTNIKGFYVSGGGGMLWRKNGSNKDEIWVVYNNCYTYFGLNDTSLSSSNMRQLTLPSSLQSEGIKEVRSVSGAFIILSNAGKLYGCGNCNSLGIGEQSGITEIKYLNKDNIKTMYSYQNLIMNQQSRYCCGPVIFTTNDGKFITTGSYNDINFGENVYQKKWKKIASNVKFLRVYYNERIGYIDNNNDVWLCGTHTLYLGLGDISRDDKMMYEFVKVTNPNIQGKAKGVYFASGNTYILTTNNEVWAAGTNDQAAGETAGWHAATTQYNYIKLLSNIEYLECNRNQRLAVERTGKAWAWGDDIFGMLGISNSTTGGYGNGSNSRYIIEATSYTLPTEIISSSKPSNIVQIQCNGWQRGAIITKEGNLYRAGSWVNGAYDGGGGFVMKNYFVQYTNTNLSLQSGEKIIKQEAMNDNTCLILTNLGRVFAYGQEQYMGINSNLTDYYELTLLNFDSGINNNVNDIVTGSGWHLIVTNDGRVFGTGSNSNGVLGRWIGTDRSMPNSRYRTAFEWVECPDLEI